MLNIVIQMLNINVNIFLIIKRIGDAKKKDRSILDQSSLNLLSLVIQSQETEHNHYLRVL